MAPVRSSKGGSQYMQTRRSVGGCRAGIDLSSIPATALEPCRINGFVYCEPALKINAPVEHVNFDG